MGIIIVVFVFLLTDLTFIVLLTSILKKAYGDNKYFLLKLIKGRGPLC